MNEETGAEVLGRLYDLELARLEIEARLSDSVLIDRMADIDREYTERMTELHKEFNRKTQEEKMNHMVAHAQLAQEWAMQERLVILPKTSERVNHVERDGLRDKIKMFMVVARWLKERLAS